MQIGHFHRGQGAGEHPQFVHGPLVEFRYPEDAADGQAGIGAELGVAAAREAGEGQIVVHHLGRQQLAVAIQLQARRAAGAVIGGGDVDPLALGHGSHGLDVDLVVGAGVDNAPGQGVVVHADSVGRAIEQDIGLVIFLVGPQLDPQVQGEGVGALELADVLVGKADGVVDHDAHAVTGRAGHRRAVVHHAGLAARNA